ncbi:MAG: thioredoxin domain-containing protein [Candidatus Aenigmatarchaeota archaeon]
MDQENKEHKVNSSIENLKKPQEGDKFVDNMFFGLIGFFGLGVLILIGFVILSNSINDLSKALSNYTDSNQKLIDALTSNSGNQQQGSNTKTSKDNQLNPQPKRKTITVNDAVFEYVDLSLLDYSKASGKIEVSNPKLVIVEFTDLQCPYCRRFWGDSAKFLKENYVKKGIASYYVFDFPLSFHPDALNMSNAARCAGEQGKYFEMFDKLFAYQDTQGTGTVRVSSEKINDIAKEIGLDMNKFNQCQTSLKYQQDIMNSMSEGIKVGVQGTPAIYINGYLIPGAYPSSYVKGLVEKILQS